MGPALLLSLWMFVIRLAVAAGFKEHCTIPSVQKGEATNITCYLGKDINETRLDRTVHKYKNGSAGGYRDILNCVWPKKTQQCVVVDPNYTLKDDTDTLVLEIPSASEEYVGTYECLTLSSDPSVRETCNFTLRYDNTSAVSPTQPAQTTTTDSEVSDHKTIHIVSAVSGVVVLVLLIVILVCICRRWKQGKAGDVENQDTSSESQSLLRPFSRPKLEKTENLPFDHDTCDKALNVLEEKKCVIIMGPGKCGKTTIGRTLQRHFKDEGYTPADLIQHDNWNQWKNSTEKLIVLLDEVFTIDQTPDVASWSPVFTSMQKRGCLIIVIIRTGTNTEGEEINLPFLLKRFPKVFAANDNLKNELFRVCQKGELKDLKGLLDHRVDVNVVNDKGESPLHIACTHGREDIVKSLVSHNADVNIVNDKGESPLHIACTHGLEDVVKSLVSHKADVNIVNDKGESPLHIACTLGIKGIVEQLVGQAKGNINARNKQGQTPLHNACSRDVDKARNITSARVVLDEKEQLAWTAYDLTDQEQNTESSERKFEDQKTANTSADVMQVEVPGEAHGDEITDLLLAAGVDPEAIDNQSRTPLHLACCMGNSSAVISLLNAANIEAEKLDGVRTRHAACEQNRLCSDCMVEARDKQKWTPLHCACVHGNGAVVTLLLEAGADIEAADESGTRALHMACKSDKEQIVQILLDHGADIEAVDESGARALHMACKSDNEQIVQILLDHRADIEAADERGTRALHTACKSGNEQIVQILLDHGADVKAKTKDGKKPSDLAKGPNRQKIVDLIKQAGKKPQK